MKCIKCGKEPQETDKLAWKCTSCGKAYGVNLSYLQKIQKKKNSSGTTGLLKCKECGQALDNGNEKIFWKCPCENMQSGKLEEYGETRNIAIVKNESASLLAKQNIEFCPDCGAKLKKDEKYCSNCGKLVSDHGKSRFCEECGGIVSRDKRFCPHCGHKMSVEISNGLSIKTNRTIGIKSIVISVAVIFIIIGLFFVGKNVIPQLLVSANELLAEGDYEKAYSKAKKDEKDEILLENLISYECKEAVNNLKDPSSFQLIKAWYDKKTGRIILSISGKNGMGGASSSYWYYNYSKEENEYQLVTVINDLDEEDYSYFDDAEDKLEKAFNNAARDIIKDIIYETDNKIDSSTVKNINGLYKKNILQDVELLDEVEKIYPKKNDKV